MGFVSSSENTGRSISEQIQPQLDQMATEREEENENDMEF
jgi:ribosomal protein S19E (S16A)